MNPHDLAFSSALEVADLCYKYHSDFIVSTKAMDYFHSNQKQSVQEHMLFADYAFIGYQF